MIFARGKGFSELFQRSRIITRSCPRALPWAGICERLRRSFQLTRFRADNDSLSAEPLRGLHEISDPEVNGRDHQGSDHQIDYGHDASPPPAEERRRRSSIPAQGCARLARYPGKTSRTSGATLKGLPKLFVTAAVCELLQSSHLSVALSPRALPWAGIYERLRRFN